MIFEYKGIVLPWDPYRIPEEPVPRGRDQHGEYQALTGLEGTGQCWLCGQDPGGKRYRRYCWGHGKLYNELFVWTYAAPAALERAGYRCENCGVEGKYVHLYSSYSTSYNLEVHHIIPLEGRDRLCTFLNIFWNLIVFCHKCHLEIHAAMRPDGWEKMIRKAGERGQGVLEGFG